MEERAQSIRRMFSAISPRYDLLNHLLSGNIDKLWRHRVAREVITADTRAVLDLCAGTGDLSFALSQALSPGGHIIALDFSLEMLRIAQRKYAPSSALHSVSFVEGDGLRLPFPNDQFDAVTVAFGLRNLVDWQGGLHEMARVTHKGGKVAVLEFSLPRHQPFRALYLFYFTRMLPVIGKWFSGSTAYQYLTDTVLQWPNPQELRQMMERADLRDISIIRLTGGIACLHIGVKA